MVRQDIKDIIEEQELTEAWRALRKAYQEAIQPIAARLAEIRNRRAVQSGPYTEGRIRKTLSPGDHVK